MEKDSDYVAVTVAGPESRFRCPRITGSSCTCTAYCGEYFGVLSIAATSAHVATPTETPTNTRVKTEHLVRPVFEVIPMYESGDQWRGKLLGYRIWMKVGGESSVIYTDENKTLCEERAVKFRAMFQSAEAVPEGLIQRVEAALQRIEENRAPRRIPADPTDVDLVLYEVLMHLRGIYERPFWLGDQSEPHLPPNK